MSDHSHALGKYETHVHVAPVSKYMKVFGALLVLTGITVWVSTLGLSPSSVSVGVAMAIAVVKALMVMTFFMHLDVDTPFNRAFIGSAFWFMSIFFAFTLLDIGTRGTINPEEDNFVPGQERDVPEGVIKANEAAAKGEGSGGHH